jgi:hypothetical protein
VTTPTKEQVIAAVEAEINPSTPGKMRIKPVALIALRRPHWLWGRSFRPASIVGLRWALEL